METSQSFWPTQYILRCYGEEASIQLLEDMVQSMTRSSPPALCRAIFQPALARAMACPSQSSSSLSCMADMAALGVVACKLTAKKMEDLG